MLRSLGGMCLHSAWRHQAHYQCASCWRDEGYAMAEKGLIRITVMPEKLADMERSVDWTRFDAMTEKELERNLAHDPNSGSPLTKAEGKALLVQVVRRRSGLSEERFAERFHIPLETLRDWETMRREPDEAAIACLRVIDRE